MRAALPAPAVKQSRTKSKVVWENAVGNLAVRIRNGVPLWQIYVVSRVTPLKELSPSVINAFHWAEPNAEICAIVAARRVPSFICIFHSRQIQTRLFFFKPALGKYKLDSTKDDRDSKINIFPPLFFFSFQHSNFESSKNCEERGGYGSDGEKLLMLVSSWETALFWTQTMAYCKYLHRGSSLPLSPPLARPISISNAPAARSCVPLVRSCGARAPRPKPRTDERTPPSETSPPPHPPNQTSATDVPRHLLCGYAKETPLEYKARLKA